MSRRNKDGIEWQTGFALNGSAVYRLLNGKAQKAVTKKRKRLPFSDHRERLPKSQFVGVPIFVAPCFGGAPTVLYGGGRSALDGGAIRDCFMGRRKMLN